MVRRPLCIGLALAAALALPAAAGAVLPGTNGRIVLISGPAFGNTQLFLRPVFGSTGGGSMSPALATGLTLQHRHPTWSPDRTKIAFAEGTGRCAVTTSTPSISPRRGRRPMNITNSPGVTDDRPAWSPDGTRIAYESGNDIIVHALTGGGDLNLTTTLTPKAWKAAWSPDSQTLYYSVGDITLAPNGTNNDIRLYQQPANNSSAGTELLHVQRRPCVPALDLTRRDEALLHVQHSPPGTAPRAIVVAASLSDPARSPSSRSTRRGRLQLHLVAGRNQDRLHRRFRGNWRGLHEELRRDGHADRPHQYRRNVRRQPRLGARRAAATAPTASVDHQAGTRRSRSRSLATTPGPAYERTDVKEFKDTQPATGR